MRTHVFGIGALAAYALVAAAGAGVNDIDSVRVVERVFNDFGATTLTTTNNYPSSVRIQESNFTPDGGADFANRHIAWFSEDGGATNSDFDYADGFDISFDMTVDSAPSDGGGRPGAEAGFQADLFGFGFFGALTGNGEIAAFGSTLPFHSFGTGLYSVGDTVNLRMIYRPGSGEGMMPFGSMEYIYDLGAGPVSSGLKPFSNAEGGFPTAFSQFLGFGIQNNAAGGGSSDVTFSNIVVVPAPAGAAALGIGLALAGLRRRR